MTQSNAPELPSGTKVKIAIRTCGKPGYTIDLYNSIQGKEGIIVRQHNSPDKTTYKDAYLIEFDNQVTKDFYASSATAAWGGIETKMTWWIERKDFKII
jgi:hypothetical protein